MVKFNMDFFYLGFQKFGIMQLSKVIIFLLFLHQIPQYTVPYNSYNLTILSLDIMTAWSLLDKQLICMILWFYINIWFDTWPLWYDWKSFESNVKHNNISEVLNTLESWQMWKS